MLSKSPHVFITNPIATAAPKTPNITKIELGSEEGISFKIGACGVPKKPVTHSAKGSRTFSVPKNSPVKSPMIELEIPIDIKIGANLFHLPTLITFRIIKIPNKTKNIPCPKSPNMIPNKIVKKIATNGLGSIVP